MSELKIRRLAYALGAEVRGVDLAGPLDDSTVAEIRAAWLEHLLLCFPGQNLERDELFAFAKRFGEPQKGPKANMDPDNPFLTFLTEKPVQGKPWYGYKGGQNWHTDQSFTTQPTSGTFLSCKEIPPVGGDTMFANTYLAYETLSPAMRNVVERLSAIHDGTVLRPRYHGANVREQRTASEIEQSIKERAAAYPPTVQPVVRIHPETKRKALYLGDRGVSRFVGMTEDESSPLLTFLGRHAVRYEFTYRHRWTASDLVMWDNRCMLHIALSDYDLGRDARFMIRCAVAGEASGHHYTPQDDAWENAGKELATLSS